jgi:hypothetical protein
VQLITGKIGLGVPERPSLNAHHLQASLGELIDEHSSSGAQSYDDNVNFLIPKLALVEMGIAQIIVMITVVFE